MARISARMRYPRTPASCVLWHWRDFILQLSRTQSTATARNASYGTTTLQPHRRGIGRLGWDFPMRAHHVHFTPAPPGPPDLFEAPAVGVDTSRAAAARIAGHAARQREAIFLWLRTQ